MRRVNDELAARPLDRVGGIKVRIAGQLGSFVQQDVA